MPYHTKACPIARLRGFASWPQDREADDAVVFVHPDFSVRRTSLPGEDEVIWSGSGAFQSFCEVELAFAPGS